MFKHSVIYTSVSGFYRVSLSLLVLVLFFSGCEDTEVKIPAGAFTEQIVDLQGTWKVNQVWLNNIDISDQIDFSKLQLTLNMDGNGPTNFQISSDGTPFIVRESGDWSYNDFAYPTTITFDTGGEKQIANFTVPPISTSSTFTLNFSLGCGDNDYVFEFGK